MIEKNKHIPELYELKHRHDNLLHTGSNYQEDLLKHTLSNVMFSNPILSNFLLLIQNNITHLIESNLVIRNLFNYTVDKYYNKHDN